MLLSDVFQYKSSDTAIYLGSAESIINITPEQWERIDQFDTFALNNWVYHWYVPKFYHLEVKTYNKDIVARQFNGKRPKYEKRPCRFIIRNDKAYLMDVLTDYPEVYFYTIKVLDKTKVVRKDPDYPDETPNVLYHMGQSSMSIVFDIIRRMRYKRLILFGVDYTSSRYFWTGRPEFGEVHAQWNKDHEGHDPNAPHVTVNMIDFVRGYSKRYVKTYVGYKENIFFQQSLLPIMYV